MMVSYSEKKGKAEKACIWVKRIYNKIKSITNDSYEFVMAVLQNYYLTERNNIRLLPQGKEAGQTLNFVFISPDFPNNFRLFCVRLHQNGVNVLGIGDASYESLHPSMKNALTEYYRVDSLEDYDQVLRGVGYFTGHYGKIDWLESNNEHWLELDAALRTDFNITTGMKKTDIARCRSKLTMKKYFTKAGVSSARCSRATTLSKAMTFAAQVGYPMVAKPDSSAKITAVRRIGSEQELRNFFAQENRNSYLLEEYVTGTVTAYDGICNSKGNILFAASHITPTNILDMANEQEPFYYYVDKQVPADVEKAGKAVLKALGVTSRAFHIEFIRLTEKKNGLGEVGDLIAIQAAMCPTGGFTSDMINFSQSVDMYEIWADMVAFDEIKHQYDGPRSYCVYAGRHDTADYALTMPELQAQTGKNARLFTYMTNNPAEAMGNQAAIACCDTVEELNIFIEQAFAPARKMLPVETKK